MRFHRRGHPLHEARMRGFGFPPFPPGPHGHGPHGHGRGGRGRGRGRRPNVRSAV
ncbi:PadR family transcriptional regulator, partial [Micromonospora craterilacus]